MKTYSPQDWFDLAKNFYELIEEEMDNTSPDTLPEIYPKLVVMYEFFRLVRGESFLTARPAGLGEFQNEIYKMENNLAERMEYLEKKLDPNDGKTLYFLDVMKKSFSLEYFNQD